MLFYIILQELGGIHSKGYAVHYGRILVEEVFIMSFENFVECLFMLSWNAIPQNQVERP